VSAGDHLRQFLVGHASARQFADVRAATRGERQPQDGLLRSLICLEKLLPVGLVPRVRAGLGLPDAEQTGAPALSDDLQPGAEPDGEKGEGSRDQGDQVDIRHLLMVSAKSPRK
jgi:hypothetical protein